MTTPRTVKPEIHQAIEEIRGAFPAHTLDAEPDDDGGAFIKVYALSIGVQYEPDSSWIAFRITFQYPFADIYPHFLTAYLRRKNSKSLGEGFHLNHHWEHPGGKEPATMVSRRSNRRDPTSETAALKLAKVLDWIRSR